MFTKIAVLDQSLNYICTNKAWLEDSFFSLDKPLLKGENIFSIGPLFSQKNKGILEDCTKNHYSFIQENDLWNDLNTLRYFKWEIQIWYKNTQEIGGVIIFFEEIFSLYL